MQTITLHTTLIRDPGCGLGFSIAGGRESSSYKEDTDGVYISRIAEGGVAHKDGKLQLGDKVISVCKIYVQFLCKLYYSIVYKNLLY